MSLYEMQIQEVGKVFRVKANCGGCGEKLDFSGAYNDVRKKLKGWRQLGIIERTLEIEAYKIYEHNRDPIYNALCPNCDFRFVMMSKEKIKKLNVHTPA